MDRGKLLVMGFIVLSAALVSFAALAAGPDLINFQGQLIDADTGLPVTGTTVPMTFRIFDTDTEGIPLWEESQTVDVQNGIYNVLLGSGILNPGYGDFNPSLFSGENRWLEVLVDSEILAPRQRISSTAYAMNAETLDGYEHGDFSKSGHHHDTLYVNEGQTSAINSAMIANSTISAADLGANSVGASEMANNAVGSSEIINGSIKAEDLADGPGSGLDADLLDGNHAAAFSFAGHNHNALYYTESESNSRFVNATGDSMSSSSGGGVLSATNNHATSGYGIYGRANGDTGRGIYGFAGDTGDVQNFGVYGWAAGKKGRGVFGYSDGAEGMGVRGDCYQPSGIGVYGHATEGKAVSGIATSTGDLGNYGGYFAANGNSGRGIYSQASGTGGRGVEGWASNSGDYYNYGGHFRADGKYGRGIYSLTGGESGIAVFGNASGQYGYGVYGYSGGSNGRALYGYASGSNAYAGYFYAYNTNGIGIYAYGGSNGFAADFRGNVRIRDRSSGTTVMELGKGLDYAEGFDVTKYLQEELKPGAVLVIDPVNPGKLVLSTQAYDTKVAGIVAGANGLGSGVKLGSGQFDHDVALAGRVYCNVDAASGEIKPGDMLTTSDTPGFAMKSTDSTRAHGSILGKAMQNLAKGQKSQILVLVTLQ
jgi:hypothetical protein